MVDRSLRERRLPGVYETTAKMRSPGRYEVAFFLDTPRVIHCFEARVEANPALEAERLASLPVVVEPLFGRDTVTAGKSVSLRFRLTDPISGEPETGLRDVHVMAYSTANWQQRQWASEIGDGLYEVSFTPPSPGSYTVVVECRSQRLLFHLSPPVTLRAVTGQAEEGSGRGNGSQPLPADEPRSR